MFKCTTTTSTRTTTNTDETNGGAPFSLLIEFEPPFAQRNARRVVMQMWQLHFWRAL
jgi:hypothetical protein